jgi:hypothetical protein
VVVFQASLLTELNLYAMQSARKDGPQLIDGFVNTAYEYYKVPLMTQYNPTPHLHTRTTILTQLWVETLSTGFI